MIALSACAQFIDPSELVMGRQILLSLFSGKAQLIAVFPEYVIVVPGGAASVVTAGVFTGGGGASPRQVVVMALSG